MSPDRPKIVDAHETVNQSVDRIPANQIEHERQGVEEKETSVDEGREELHLIARDPLSFHTGPTSSEGSG